MTINELADLLRLLGPGSKFALRDGITAMGFATASAAAVGMGVGAIVAAGLMAIFFALAGPLLTGRERVSTDAAEAPPPTGDSDLENVHRGWPPRTNPGPDWRR